MLEFILKSHYPCARLIYAWKDEMYSRRFRNGFSFIQVLMSLVLLVGSAIPLFEYYWHMERMGQAQQHAFARFLAQTNAEE